MKFSMKRGRGIRRHIVGAALLALGLSGCAYDGDGHSSVGLYGGWYMGAGGGCGYGPYGPYGYDPFYDASFYALYGYGWTPGPFYSHYYNPYYHGYYSYYCGYVPSYFYSAGLYGHFYWYDNYWRHAHHGGRPYTAVSVTPDDEATWTDAPKPGSVAHREWLSANGRYPGYRDRARFRRSTAGAVQAQGGIQPQIHGAAPVWSGPSAVTAPTSAPVVAPARGYAPRPSMAPPTSPSGGQASSPPPPPPRPQSAPAPRSNSGPKSSSGHSPRRRK